MYVCPFLSPKSSSCCILCTCSAYCVYLIICYPGSEHESICYWSGLTLYSHCISYYMVGNAQVCVPFVCAVLLYLDIIHSACIWFLSLFSFRPSISVWDLCSFILFVNNSTSLIAVLLVFYSGRFFNSLIYHGFKTSVINELFYKSSFIFLHAVCHFHSLSTFSSLINLVVKLLILKS